MKSVQFAFYINWNLWYEHYILPHKNTKLQPKRVISHKLGISGWIHSVATLVRRCNNNLCYKKNSTFTLCHGKMCLLLHYYSVFLDNDRGTERHHHSHRHVMPSLWYARQNESIPELVPLLRGDLLDAKMSDLHDGCPLHECILSKLITKSCKEPSLLQFM